MTRLTVYRRLQVCSLDKQALLDLFIKARKQSKALPSIRVFDQSEINNPHIRIRELQPAVDPQPGHRRKDQEKVETKKNKILSP